jgi:hypothetical protein
LWSHPAGRQSFTMPAVTRLDIIICRRHSLDRKTNNLLLAEAIMAQGQHTAHLKPRRTSPAPHIWSNLGQYVSRTRSGCSYVRPCSCRRAYRFALATGSWTGEHLEACRAGHSGVVHVDAAIHKLDCAMLGHMRHCCEAGSAGERVEGEVTGGPVVVNDTPACAIPHSSN